MGVVRLMGKKLEDARFRENEEAIFRAFFDEEDKTNLSVDLLTKKIGINRATFYRHHKTIYGIKEDYEKYILEEYTEFLGNLRKNGKTELRRIYYEMIVFVLQNKKIFGVLIKRRDSRIIEELVLGLRPEITVFVRLSSCPEIVFRVYMGEVVGLIENWGLNGFRSEEVIRLLNNVMYLTKGIRDKLLPLVN